MTESSEGDNTADEGNRETKPKVPEGALEVKAVTAQPSSIQDAEDRELFDEITQNGAKSSADSAGKWQAGILALTAFVTGGVFLKGPDAVKDLNGCWRTLFIIAVAAALVFATLGLVAFISLSSGLVISTSRDKILRKHGSVAAYIRSREERASVLTVAGVWLGLSAVVLLAIATLTWLIVPRADKPDKLVITNLTDEQVCGKLLLSTDGVLMVGDNSASTYVPVPIDTVKNIRLVNEC